MPKTVFMFSGQGSQYFQMGKDLFEQHNVFRDWMRRLDDMAWSINGTRVNEAIYGSPKSDVFARTRLTHPAIFMVEYALAQCLMHEGIEPDLVLGASLGSFTAAAVSGSLTVEQAMAAVLEQAAGFERECLPGGMIAVLGAPDLYEQEAFLRDRSELAGINFHSHFVVSAEFDELDIIEAELKRRDLTFQRLAVSYAFHSRWIDKAGAGFRAFMRGVSVKPAAIPMVCCQRAAVLNQLPDDYFWRVVRHPIRFNETVALLERQGSHRYIDVGPSGTLAAFIKYSLAQDSRSSMHAILTPFGREHRNFAALLNEVGEKSGRAHDHPRKADDAAPEMDRDNVASVSRPIPQQG